MSPNAKITKPVRRYPISSTTEDDDSASNEQDGRPTRSRLGAPQADGRDCHPNARSLGTPSAQKISQPATAISAVAATTAAKRVRSLGEPTRWRSPCGHTRCSEDEAEPLTSQSGLLSLSRAAPARRRSAEKVTSDLTTIGPNVARREMPSACSVFPRPNPRPSQPNGRPQSRTFTPKGQDCRTICAVQGRTEANWMSSQPGYDVIVIGSGMGASHLRASWPSCVSGACSS